MSKNAIRALLCSGLIVLATVGTVVFAHFRTDVRTRQSGVRSSSNTAGISVSDQARVAQTQPDQAYAAGTFSAAGSLVASQTASRILAPRLNKRSPSWGKPRAHSARPRNQLRRQPPRPSSPANGWRSSSPTRASIPKSCGAS